MAPRPAGTGRRPLWHAHWPGLGLLAWGLLGAGRVAVAGREPNPYLVHVVGIPAAQQSYDVQGVGFTVLLVTLEAGLLAACLRPASYPGRAWGRGLGAAGVALAFAALDLLTLMHAPPSAVAAAEWSWLTLALLPLLVAGLEIRAWRRRRTLGSRRPGNPPASGTIDPR